MSQRRLTVDLKPGNILSSHEVKYDANSYSVLGELRGHGGDDRLGQNDRLATAKGPPSSGATWW
jgi:hypothetical protein